MKRIKEFKITGEDNLYDVPTSVHNDFHKLVLDESTSMRHYISEMKKSLQYYKSEVSSCDEASRIFVSKATFSGEYVEDKYKNISEFSPNYSVKDCTNLYDAIVYSIDNAISVKESLLTEGFNPRMFNIYFTDGYHECYHNIYDFNEARTAVQRAIDNKIKLVFVDFGGNNKDIPTQLGFVDVYSPEESSEALMQVIAQITKSTISQSKMEVVNPKDWLRC